VLHIYYYYYVVIDFKIVGEMGNLVGEISVANQLIQVVVDSHTTTTIVIISYH
jgi:hypothetical protein